MNISESVKNLTRFERALWLVSALAVIPTFFIGGVHGILSAATSLIGVTALIFVAKGDVLGQVLCLIFATLYGIISFSFSYYGEMITYLGMSAPIALAAIISWARHPFEKGKNEVEVNALSPREYVLTLLSSLVVTAVFYFILNALGTANLIPSTLSVATSLLASYLTFRRSRFYAVAYAANDIVLIVLWILATLSDVKYIAMVVCFVMFLANDLYGFINWTKMKNEQKKAKKELPTNDEQI